MVAKFHTAAFMLTGLCDWEGIAVQLSTAVTVWTDSETAQLVAVYDQKSLAVVGIVWCVANEWWINKVMQSGDSWSLRAHSWFGSLSGGNKEAWQLRVFFDAADLIMTWCGMRRCSGCTHTLLRLLAVIGSDFLSHCSARTIH